MKNNFESLENLYIFHPRTKNFKILQIMKEKHWTFPQCLGRTLYITWVLRNFPTHSSEIFIDSILFFLTYLSKLRAKLSIFCMQTMSFWKIYLHSHWRTSSSHSIFQIKTKKKKQLNFLQFSFFISFVFWLFLNFSFFSHPSFLKKFSFRWFFFILFSGLLPTNFSFKYKDFFFLFLPKDYGCISGKKNNLAISSKKWHFPIILDYKLFNFRENVFANLWGVFRRSVLFKRRFSRSWNKYISSGK